MIRWHYGKEDFVEGEEYIALYEVFGIGSVYMPVKNYDRGVKKWISLKELNEMYGIEWTADEHCKALN